jgi:hypothetical protein
VEAIIREAQERSSHFDKWGNHRWRGCFSPVRPEQ